MAKCKKCPRWRVCRNECYGESPCEFAVAFDQIGKKLDTKTTCAESMKAERDEARGKAPVHRIFGDYVLTSVPNAFNRKRSWWISKKGFGVARYCFTTSSEKEADYQIRTGIRGYIDLLENMLGEADAAGQQEDVPGLSGDENLETVSLWEESRWGNWRKCPHCGALVQQAEDYVRSGLYRFCPRCGKEVVARRLAAAGKEGGGTCEEGKSNP